MRSRNKSLIVGVVLLLIGVIGFYFFFRNLKEIISYNPNLYFLGFGVFPIIAAIGLIIIGAHFKAWLERSTGTRF